MVTLITEKLQNQSLDDLTRRTCEAGPVSQLGGSEVAQLTVQSQSHEAYTVGWKQS